MSPSNGLRADSCSDQSKKQRDGERWRRRKLDRKHRVNTCRTNSVKQTRRETPDTRNAYASIVKLLPSLFSYRINGYMNFFCWSWSWTDKTVIHALSYLSTRRWSTCLRAPAYRFNNSEHNQYSLSSRPISTAHAHISNHTQAPVYKEYPRISSIRTRLRLTSSQERKCCWLGRECSLSPTRYWK